MSNIVNIKHGMSFPVLFIIFPVIAFAVAFPFNMLFSIILSCLLLIYILAIEGIQIDLENNQYRKYTSYLFIKIGKWKSLEGYTSICIIKKKIAHSQASRSMRTNNFTTDLTAIYLTDKTHRYKIYLDSKPGQLEAGIRATSLATLLNKTFESYNPKISEKTKNRRR